MKRVIFEGFQRPEFPSIAYTPSNFWNTMCMIDGIELVQGRQPKLERQSDSFNKPFLAEPSPYYAGFYYKPRDVLVLYEWHHPEAKVTLFSEEDSMGEVENIIFSEHRQLDEKLAARKVDERRQMLNFH